MEGKISTRERSVTSENNAHQTLSGTFLCAHIKTFKADDITHQGGHYILSAEASCPNAANEHDPVYLPGLQNRMKRHPTSQAVPFPGIFQSQRRRQAALGSHVSIPSNATHTYLSNYNASRPTDVHTPETKRNKHSNVKVIGSFLPPMYFSR